MHADFNFFVSSSFDQETDTIKIIKVSLNRAICVAAEAGTDPDIQFQHYVLGENQRGGPHSIRPMQNEIRQLSISLAGNCTLGGFKGQGSGNLLRDYHEWYERVNRNVPVRFLLMK